MGSKYIIFFILIILLILSFFFSIIIGSVKIGLKEIFNVNNYTIIFKIRLPRIILGILVGSGLAVSGLIFQSILRNPLADPYTLGISGGAAFGVSIIILFNLQSVLGGLWIVIGSFSGAVISIIIVYFLAERSYFLNTTLILAGIVMSYLFSSMVLFVYALLSADKVHNMILWLMGDLSSANVNFIKIIAPLIIVLFILIILFNRELNIISLGEEKATYLGINTKLIKKIFFIIASLITGLCVSVSGVIGFVGLIVPHIMRMLIGADHSQLIPASMLSGAIFLLLSDTIARTIISPIELPVGVITGIFGALFFLSILIKTRRFEF